MAIDTQQANDAMAEVLVAATDVAELAAHLRDHVVARNIEFQQISRIGS